MAAICTALTKEAEVDGKPGADHPTACGSAPGSPGTDVRAWEPQAAWSKEMVAEADLAIYDSLHFLNSLNSSARALSFEE
jgi:hypothetical protein